MVKPGMFNPGKSVFCDALDQQRSDIAHGFRISMKISNPRIHVPAGAAVYLGTSLSLSQRFSPMVLNFNVVMIVDYKTKQVSAGRCSWAGPDLHTTGPRLNHFHA